MDVGQAKRWLSEPRFHQCLARAGGDAKRAVALHEWQEELGSAYYSTQQRFELLLRNAIDAQLGAGQHESPVASTWLHDATILRPNALQLVAEAETRLQRGPTVTRGRVVATLSFGFWTGLFGSRYEQLWRNSLRHAFPNGPGRRDLLPRPLEDLRKLRNRVAHHDSLFDQDVNGRYGEMMRIARWIDVDAEFWLRSSSNVLRILAMRP